jgi:uncharacterized membrane protein YtjA (UPF0391 family)
MFRIAIGLLILAVIAAIFGFGGLAGTATDLAKIVFVVALVLAVISFLMGGRGSTALAFVLALSIPTLTHTALRSANAADANGQSHPVTPVLALNAS